ncbi:hypothetical protein RN001_015311, partial [Aquatica leii]
MGESRKIKNRNSNVNRATNRYAKDNIADKEIQNIQWTTDGNEVIRVLLVQRFEQQPAYTEVNPGQNALLACKVLNKKGSCSWQKDNK